MRLRESNRMNYKAKWLNSGCMGSDSDEREVG